MDATARSEFQGYSNTVRGIAFDASRSMDDEKRISLKVLLVKNRGELYRKDKQFEKVAGERAKEKLRDGKPAGLGCPSGSAEDKESIDSALRREARDESGFNLRYDRYLYRFAEPVAVKPHIKNVIWGYIYEADDLQIPIKESNEIEYSAWFEIENILELPIVDPSNNNNPENAIYFSHRKFIIWVLRFITVLDVENLPEKPSPDFKKWLARYKPLIEEKYVELLSSGAVLEDEEVLSALAKAGLIEWTDAETV